MSHNTRKIKDTVPPHTHLPNFCWHKNGSRRGHCRPLKSNTLVMGIRFHFTFISVLDCTSLPWAGILKLDHLQRQQGYWHTFVDCYFDLKKGHCIFKSYFLDQNTKEVSLTLVKLLHRLLHWNTLFTCGMLQCLEWGKKQQHYRTDQELRRVGQRFLEI